MDILQGKSPNLKWLKKESRQNFKEIYKCLSYFAQFLKDSLVFDLQFSHLFVRDKVLQICFFFKLQEYARKALDFLWEKRQRSSNLVGVTINIHTGDWVRKGMQVGFKMRPSHSWDGHKYSIFLCEDDRGSIVSYFSHIAFARAGRDKTLVSLRIKGSEHFVAHHSLVMSQSPPPAPPPPPPVSPSVCVYVFCLLKVEHRLWSPVLGI